MSKNFMDYESASAVLSEYADDINAQKPVIISYSEYQQLTPTQQQEHRWVIQNYPDSGGVTPSEHKSVKVVRLNQTVTITADGVKTFNELLAELTVALNENLDSNSLVDFISFTSTSIDYDLWTRTGLMVKNTEYLMSHIRIAASDADFKSMRLGTTANRCFAKKLVHTNMGTIVDVGGTVPASGIVMTLYYNLYTME